MDADTSQYYILLNCLKLVHTVDADTSQYYILLNCLKLVHTVDADTSQWYSLSRLNLHHSSNACPDWMLIHTVMRPIQTVVVPRQWVLLLLELSSWFYECVLLCGIFPCLNYSWLPLLMSVAFCGFVYYYWMQPRRKPFTRCLFTSSSVSLALFLLHISTVHWQLDTVQTNTSIRMAPRKQIWCQTSVSL